MKKLILFSLLFTCFTVAGQPLQPTPPSKDTLVQVTLPDNFTVVIGKDTVNIPAKDARIIVDTVKDLVDGRNGNWPGTPLGWVTLAVTLLFSAKGTQVVTSGRRIYAFLKVFLRKTLNIVAFVSGIIAALLTLMFGEGAFDYSMFTTIWGGVAFGSVYIYENFVKKKEKPPIVPVTPVTPPAPSA